ncbi:Patched family protein [Gammaproteobacteria bacterium 42_54_T18]|nr:Patched family protein [Gammaproteobacteria bacterium 42_54_T18]
MSDNPRPSTARAIAKLIVHYPKTQVAVSLLLMIALFMALPMLYKDTRSDAFLADDNPALVYRDKVKEQFGLSDPIVLAVINTSDNGVFNPTSLSLIQWLSDEVSSLDNINADRVTSLATENNITGSDDGMDVEPFFESAISTQQEADIVWSKVSDFPLYMGNLVAHDKQATLIVAELLDVKQVEDTYQQILDIVARSPNGKHDEIHVAGEGAIAGYLGSYIDADAQRLNPLAGVIITIIILFAFRRVSTGILSNVIIAASVLMTLSIMALNGIPFFVITNALPVILIGISVADSIHIYSHYFELQAKHPSEDKKELIIQTVEEMWRPITLTTLTTIAGFMGMYFAAYMPPFKYFGLYTAVGVAIAWFYSLVFLPAALAIIQPSASKQIGALAKSNRLDKFSRTMVVLGRISLQNPKVTVGLFSIIIISGIFATSHLVVNEDRIKTFHTSETLYQADAAINAHLNGTNNLDVVIEAKEAEALFEPEHLKKMEALQNFALTLPNVQGATSIVDYLKQMNRSLKGGDKYSYQLPDNKALIAQYFLIYSASSDPTDFDEEVDYDYRIANIKLTLNKGSYVDTQEVVTQLNDYIKTSFNNQDISATLSGRVNINYHWIKDLGRSHFVGLAISMFLVWAVSSLLFGSLTAGTFTIIPVSSSILLVYSAMAVLGIDLGIGTSMFASVAIGLGVDFSIHTIDRLRSLYQDHNGNWDLTLQELYPSTGRALFLNYLAIACGFGVLISSKVVPLNNFGTIVVISVSTSFLASMSFLPALIKLTKPTFISGYQPSDKTITRRWIRIPSIILLVAVAGSVLVNQPALASESETGKTTKSNNLLPSAEVVVANINNVDDGEYATRNLTMTLIDKRGKKRVRETIGYRKYFGKEKRTILFYKKPTNVKGTAFLTFDYPGATKDDDQWLYLPALRKVRRISAADRGDYFLGTDFTYEDIKLEGKIDSGNYNFETIRSEVLAQESSPPIQTVVIRGIAKNNVIAKELGYGKTEFWVDVDTWLIAKSNYWDPKGKLLKTLTISDVSRIDGILTRHRMTINNHKTGHTSEFLFSNVDYKAPVSDGLFTKRAMKRGK